jgi:hypothetical protein
VKHGKTLSAEAHAKSLGFALIQRRYTVRYSTVIVVTMSMMIAVSLYRGEDT